MSLIGPTVLMLTSATRLMDRIEAPINESCRQCYSERIMNNLAFAFHKQLGEANQQSALYTLPALQQRGSDRRLPDLA